MATIDWEAPDGITTYLSTELNALADDANKLGAAIDNETDRKRFLAVEVFLSTQGAARDTGAFIQIDILYSVDGTNYAFGADALDASLGGPSFNLPFDAAVTARYQTAVDIPIYPYKFKLLFKNSTGEALGGTLSTLKYRRHNGEVD